GGKLPAQRREKRRGPIAYRQLTQGNHGSDTAQKMPSHSRASSATAPAQRTAAEVVNNEFSDDAASCCEEGVNVVINAMN
ncbi:hypothetical protein, partial [Serratia marcescens]|uniref:hypothetical protein n=2 Tax=Serratia marcescens TaxID=615 RepID=UPI001C64F3A9